MVCTPRVIALGLIPLLLIVTGGCGTTATGGGGGGTIPVDEGGEDTTQNGDPTEEPTFITQNEGGGDLAARAGGATFAGEATGPIHSGTLSLTFDNEGVLTSLGGTVLGSFFALPSGSEVTFDYAAASVTGTYAEGDGSTQSLEHYLTNTASDLVLRGVVVTLASDSLTVLTGYTTNLPGTPGDSQSLTVAATLRFGTNDTLQGSLALPGLSDESEPLFTLDRL